VPQVGVEKVAVEREGPAHLKLAQAVNLVSAESGVQAI
jgi:hypothetical protein